MMTRVAFLLITFLIQGAHSTVFSCDEIYRISDGQHYQSGNYTCVVFQGSTTTATATGIFLDDGTNKYSLAEVANSPGHCVTGSGVWIVTTILENSQIDCSSEISIIFSSIPLSIFVANATLIENSTPSMRGTLVSPAAGMRMEKIQCSFDDHDTTVTMYSGAGKTTDMLYVMETFRCDQLPTAYVAFENVITYEVAGKTQSSFFEFSLTSNYNDGKSPLLPGDHVTVASSGQADNLQNLHPDRNHARFQLSSESTVTATGKMNFDPRLGGTIELTAQGRFYNKTQSFTGTNLTWTVYANSFEVRYVTAGTPDQVWINNDRFVIDIAMDILPSNLTTPSPPTTQTPQPTTRQTTEVTSTAHAATTTPSKQNTTPLPTTVTPSPPSPFDYCSCQANTSWIDVVFLVDATASMGQDGLDFVVAMIQSTLAQLTFIPTSNGKFYTRAAVVSYAKDAQVIRDFSNLTSYDDLFQLDIPLKGGNDVNISMAIFVAMDIFDRYADSRRNFTPQVIVIAANAYKNDVHKVADEFKSGGGIIVTIDYVQRGERPTSGLLSLSTPGYSFTNDDNTRFDFHDLVQAFCDANCYCKDDWIPYVIDNNERQIPNGGCYKPSGISAIQPAAANACAKQKAFLSTIHDNDKQFFLMGLFSTKTKYFIGYELRDGMWQWADQSTNTFTNWATGQPDGSGNCAFSVQTTGFKSAWNATSCYTSACQYACQSRPCDSSYYCF